MVTIRLIYLADLELITEQVQKALLRTVMA